MYLSIFLYIIYTSEHEFKMELMIPGFQILYELVWYGWPTYAYKNHRVIVRQTIIKPGIQIKHSTFYNKC